MKAYSLTTALLGVVLALAVLPADLSHAQGNPATGKPTFACEGSGDGLATVAKLSGEIVRVVSWQVEFFDGAAAYPLEKRCAEVAKRLQSFYDKGELSYLTFGKINNIPVLCTAQRVGGLCENPLFSVKREVNTSSFLGILLGLTNTSPSVSFTYPIADDIPQSVYIDVSKLLKLK